MYTFNELNKMLKAELIKILTIIKYEAVILEERRAASKAIYQLKVNGLLLDFKNCLCMSCKDDRRWTLARFLHNLNEIKKGHHLPNFHVDTSNLCVTNPMFEQMTKKELIDEILRVNQEIIKKNTELVVYLSSFRNSELEKWEKRLNTVVLNPPKKAKIFYKVVEKAFNEFNDYVKSNT